MDHTPRCFRCGKVGHIFFTCSFSLHCFNYNGERHKAIACPDFGSLSCQENFKKRVVIRCSEEIKKPEGILKRYAVATIGDGVASEEGLYEAVKIGIRRSWSG